MGVIVARADAGDAAVLEALGFNAFARELADVVHEMAAADADEAVLDALGFNAFARELVETVQEMAAADADDEAALDVLGALARELAESVLQDTEAVGTEVLENSFPFELAEAFIQEIEVAEAEEAALEAIGFNAFARELRDIRARDEEAFLDELDYLEISRAIDRALELWKGSMRKRAAVRQEQPRCQDMLLAVDRAPDRKKLFLDEFDRVGLLTYGVRSRNESRSARVS